MPTLKCKSWRFSLSAFYFQFYPFVGEIAPSHDTTQALPSGSAYFVPPVTSHPSIEAEGDSRLAHVVRGDFNAHLVTYDESDKAFAHFAGDVR